MTTRYTQLQPEERMTLASMRQQGFSLRAIGVRLGRSASTVSREWRRNDRAKNYASKPDQHTWKKFREFIDSTLTSTRIVKSRSRNPFAPRTESIKAYGSISVIEK